VGLTMLLPVLLATVISGHMLCMLVGLLLVGAVGYALVRSLRKGWR
jgi:positive regulator of sigma E activity